MKLENHIILAGEGAIATNTARELKDRKISFIRIRNQGDPLSLEENEIIGDPTGRSGAANSRHRESAYGHCGRRQ